MYHTSPARRRRAFYDGDRKRHFLILINGWIPFQIGVFWHTRRPPNVYVISGQVPSRCRVTRNRNRASGVSEGSTHPLSEMRFQLPWATQNAHHSSFINFSVSRLHHSHTRALSEECLDTIGGPQVSPSEWTAQKHKKKHKNTARSLLTSIRSRQEILVLSAVRVEKNNMGKRHTHTHAHASFTRATTEHLNQAKHMTTSSGTKRKRKTAIRDRKNLTHLHAHLKPQRGHNQK